MDPRTITLTTVDNEAQFEEAYKRIEPEYSTLRPEEVAPINMDIASAVATVMFLWAGILKFRDTIVRTVVDFNIVRFDKILDYAMALGHANTMYLISTQPPDELQAIHDESARMRETLYSDTKALIQRNLIKEASIKDLQGSTGYKNIAIDLQILASVLKANWAAIEGKCGVQMSELEHALRLSTVMFGIVGYRENGSDTKASTADTRARAYTLFTRAYDDARRVIIFLRWHEGDADSIAPSLHPGRSGSKKKPMEEPTGSPSPATPVVTPAQPAGPSTHAIATPADKIAVGNDGPFMR